MAWNAESRQPQLLAVSLIAQELQAERAPPYIGSRAVVAERSGLGRHCGSFVRGGTFDAETCSGSPLSGYRHACRK